MKTGLHTTEEDVWEARLARLSCMLLRAFVLLMTFACFIMFGMVYYEMLQSEWRAKASKLKLEAAYCNAHGVSPMEYQEVCLPARQVIERSAYVHAFELTIEWHMQRFFPVAYCRAHSDMCMIWGVKFADSLEGLIRWLPWIMPMLTPLLAGFVWKILTRPCKRKATTTTTVPLKQIEGKMD
jgi:hypothetical protein